MSLSRHIHAVIFSSGEYYVVNYLEVAVVARARTLDETLDNLREAVSLHLEDEDPADLGLDSNPMLSVMLKMELQSAAA